MKDCNLGYEYLGYVCDKNLDITEQKKVLRLGHINHSGLGLVGWCLKISNSGKSEVLI